MKYCPQCGQNLASKIIDGVDREACEDKACGFIFWDNPVPVVAALVHYNGKYIIARNVAWPKGIFSVISGYLEKNETAEQAVVREVKEELGLDGTVSRYIGHYTFREKNQLILCYEVLASGNLHMNHELAELQCLLPSELSAYDFKPLYITENIIQDWKKLNEGMPG